ncbi:hypothetical protein ACQY0O_004796 [Thecaphora frezii]
MFHPTIAAVGLSASGITAGLYLAYPFLYNQAFLPPPPSSSSQSHPSLAHRLNLWARGYHAGKRTNPPFSLAAAIAYFSSIYLRGPDRAKRLYLIAGLLHLSAVPFTLLVIKPTNDRLFKLQKAAEEDESTVDAAEADRLLGRWTWLHNARTLVTLAALAVGSYATFGVPRW